MKSITSLLEFNNEAFNTFIHLEPIAQHNKLVSNGLLVDRDIDNNEPVNLYFLDGFFVEEIRPDNEINPPDIIPYKHGYKAESFVEIKEVIVPKHKVDIPD